MVFKFLRATDLSPQTHRELPGVLLLACALAFNAIFLAPELWIGRVPVNDAVLHLAASERIGESLVQGEPLLDPWVSEWSLGYPFWRSYQPLPHLVSAAVIWAASPFTDSASAFAALQYLLLVLLPVSAYAGSRLLGLGPIGSGVTSLLILAAGGTEELGRYGLSYGAFTWRGSGLYTQLVALHFLLFSLGCVTRALDSGRRRALASVLLAATALSHIIFGYVAFVSAALFAVIGNREDIARRLIRLATLVVPALLLLAWFVLPLLFTLGEANHSRWEAGYKWDSFGAPSVLKALVSGHLLDGDRLPFLSVLVAVGALMATLSVREILPRRLLSLAVFWLVLFFGRATWGHLLLLAAVPAHLHMHRLQAAFELGALLVAAWGIERTVQYAYMRNRALGWMSVTLVCAILVSIGVERAGYLKEGAEWGNWNLARYNEERADLEQALAAVRAILTEHPGRVSAGKAATWGKSFKVGHASVYAFVARSHMDQVSFLYHAMSLTSDIMVLRNEADPAHDTVFGVRAVIAPTERPPPPHLKLRVQYGRFAVYESSSEGYFGLVDVGARYTGPHSSMYEPNSAWLKSAWLPRGVVMAFDSSVTGVPEVARWEPFPAPARELLTARGQILAEKKEGETYWARFLLQRPCYALVKITWHPGLVAAVDGKPTPLLRVTPGFGAVPVPAGQHEVEVRYAPGLLKPFLFLLGIALFVVSVKFLPSQILTRAEEIGASRLSEWGGRLATSRVKNALILLVLIVLALHPLFRGQLVDGHDATAYPPRLVEFGQAVGDGQIPPLWAPDLGSGYGQPLFQFAPPLLYLVSYPLRVAGLGLTDSLQFALALLFAAGAIGVYRLERRAGASRPASLAGSAAWLFAPYVALDLYVRAAFAEAAAVALVPIAVLGLVTAIDRPSLVRMTLGSLAVALIPLAHNAIALLVFPVLAVVIVTRWNWRAWLSGCAVMVLGLGLSAFFWLPALVERGLVKTHLLLEGPMRWRLHAVSPLQLVWSKWDYGYSVLGPDDGMSFAIGPLHLLLGVVGLIIVLRSGNRTRRLEGVAFAIAAIAGAWLATSWSAPIWSRVETLQYLAYPWRALFLPATFLPLLMVTAFDRVNAKICLGAVVILILVNLPNIQPKGFLTYDDEYYAPQSIAQKGINTTTGEEYEPRWVVRRPPYTTEKIRGLDVPLQVQEIISGSTHRKFRVQSEEATMAEAAVFYYPDWTARVDEREVPVQPVPGRGTISFNLPPGKHDVRLDLESTPVRRNASLLSLITAVGLLIAATIPRLWGIYKKRNRKSQE